MNNRPPIFAGSIPNQINNINYESTSMENLLKINKGKKIKISTITPYTNNEKEYDGILEYTGQNYLILSDPNNGKWYIIPTPYIYFICSQEQINY